VRALNHLLSLYRSREEKQGYERWLRKQFNTADLDKSKCLSFPETLKLLKQLNIVMDESDAKKLFHEANVNKASGGGTKAGNCAQESLDEDEFVLLYFKLLRRPDLEQLFERFVPFFLLAFTQTYPFVYFRSKDFLLYYMYFISCHVSEIGFSSWV
jgi:hypothetical protein